MSLIRTFQKIYRTVYKVNRNAGFSILTNAARITGRVSPGLNRFIFGRYASAGGKRLLMRHGKWVVPGLTTALGGIAFGLYHFLRDDRDSLVAEDKSNLRMFGENETDVAFGKLDQLSFNADIINRLKTALMALSTKMVRTDIEAFSLIAEVNTHYLSIFSSINDPKVLDMATKHLLEATALYRQGLSYEHGNASLEGQALYNSYEADPTPQGKAEFLLAMEAASRSNTRLTSDLYE